MPLRQAVSGPDNGAMTKYRRYSLPPGRQPYDPVNGFRVGGFAGGVSAALVFVALTGRLNIWVVLAGALIGGTIGYGRERRRIRRGSQE